MLARNDARSPRKAGHERRPEHRTQEYTRDPGPIPAAPYSHPDHNGGRAAGLRIGANVRANQPASAHSYHCSSTNSGSGDGYARSGNPDGYTGGANRHTAARHGCSGSYRSAHSGSGTNAYAHYRASHGHAGAWARDRGVLGRQGGGLRDPA